MRIMLENLMDNFSQIFAIAEKNVKTQLRYKLNLVLKLVNPLLGIILPLIIMGKLLTFSENFGPWNKGNFVVYQFTSYQIVLIYHIIGQFQTNITEEKGLNTLTLIILAPFKKINLLFGIFFSHLALISVPFLAFFILCYIFYSVSIFTVFFIFFVFFILALFFSGIGLVFAVVVIAKQRLVSLLYYPLTLALLFSCLTLPFEFFPENFKFIVSLNPFYYLFNLIRLIWIEDNIIFSISSHLNSFIIVLIVGIISPILGLKIFSYVYNRYGIAIY